MSPQMAAPKNIPVGLISAFGSIAEIMAREAV
jgi:hypothetical protein